MTTTEVAPDDTAEPDDPGTRVAGAFTFAVVKPLVFVIDKSADRLSVSMSVALLFAGLGSVTPEGTATVAVFDRFPLAD